MSQLPDDEAMMTRALDEARLAAAHGDVPVGAIARAVDGTMVVAHNRREAANDPTAHAEVLALRELGARTRRWNLEGATVWVTQEPCPMCAGAIVNARVARLVYGCANPKAGAARTLYRLLDEGKLNHRVEVESGVLAEACGELLSDFFRALRG